MLAFQGKVSRKLQLIELQGFEGSRISNGYQTYNAMSTFNLKKTKTKKQLGKNTIGGAR